MVQLHFREVQDLLCEGVYEDKGLCDEERITRALGVPNELCEDALGIIFGLSESVDDGMSVAFDYSDDVLYVRIYDGERYVFPLPFMLSEQTDAEGACLSLASYATRELIPFIITDVPRDELEFLCSVFPHVDAFTYEDDDDSFYVKINNECDMLDSVPSLRLDGILLDEILDSDKQRYAQLCRDRGLNKYWGYDADVDNPDGDPDLYLSVARREIEDGVALALAIREGGEFVGEATVYGFDYRGAAQIAVRVLPSCHGRGIGSRATRALIELCRNIGVTVVKAEILNENENSIKMTSKYMTVEKHTESKTLFTLSL